MGHPVASIVLTEEEKSTLQRYVRRGTTSQQLAERSRIILACARGLNNREVAKEIGVIPHTVGKWRQRYVQSRLDGLHDCARPGTPRSIGDEIVEKVIVQTLETIPKGATHWTTRGMAKSVGISRETVGRIWRAFGLKPHLSESFQLSTDPLFIEKVRDVVGLYLSPPDNALVLSVDEKSQIQALNRAQPMLPMQMGQKRMETPEYRRHGTTSLFAALDVATGKVIGKCYRQHRAIEFRKFLELIDSSVELNLEVHIVLDNLATHKTPIIKRWLERHPRYHVHFIPTHSSWLNQIERWFALLTNRQIKRGAHCSVLDLEEAIYEFLDVHNQQPKPFRWTKSADEILRKTEAFCKRTLRTQGVDQI